MKLDWAMLSILINILTIIGTIIGGLRILNVEAGRYARLELKTDTMWDLLIKEAVIDSRRQGSIVKRSAERLNDNVAASFGELGIKLREFYKQNHLQEVKENELILILAQNFADELIEKIAMPLNMNLRQALLAAAFFLKDKNA